MGMADIATVLFRDFMQFDAADPHWFDRDRFVLSNGHASMLLYSLLYLTGYEDMTLDELKRFRQIDSKTAGHPEYKHADGIETATNLIWARSRPEAFGTSRSSGRTGTRVLRDTVKCSASV
jgi:transketolase